MSLRAGQTYEPILEDAPQGITADLTVGIVKLPAETVLVAAAAHGITEYEQADDTSNYQAVSGVTVPDDASPGQYAFAWYVDGEQVGSEPFTVGAGTVSGSPFATVPDIETRLARSLTDAETDQVEQLLSMVADSILEAAGKDEDWVDEQDTLPGAFRWVSVEAVVRVLLNPAGAKSTAETLGAHSYSQDFGAADGAGGLQLTIAEERRIRRAVLGSFHAVTLATPYSGDAVDDSELPLS